MLRGRKLLGAVTALAGGLILSIPARSAFAQNPHVPSGWHALANAGEYTIGSDVAQRPGGQGSLAATIKSQAYTPLDVGLLQQSIKADHFRNHRIQLTAYVKTEHGEDGNAHLWMRVDGADATLSSDYMQKRPIGAGRDWALYSIVLDVPANAVGITFGVAQNGAGQLWVDDVTLDEVNKNIPITGKEGGLFGFWRLPTSARHVSMKTAYSRAPMLPVNLDFEQVAVAMR